MSILCISSVNVNMQSNAVLSKMICRNLIDAYFCEDLNIIVNMNKIIVFQNIFIFMMLSYYILTLKRIGYPLNIRFVTLCLETRRTNPSLGSFLRDFVTIIIM